MTYWWVNQSKTYQAEEVVPRSVGFEVGSSPERLT
jgi:hypothetical protein